MTTENAQATRENAPTAAPSAESPDRPRRGAPRGNTNRMSHGLAAGRLPAGCGWIRTITNRFARALEAAIDEREGREPTLYESALITSATKWERHGLLALRWLREHAGEMDHATRLSYSREIARASSERDKCIKEMGLDKAVERDIWADALSGRVIPQEDPGSRESDDRQNATNEPPAAENARDAGPSATEDDTR